MKSSWRLALVAFLIPFVWVLPAAAVSPIAVSGEETGAPLGESFTIWHDPTGAADVAQARTAFQAGEFTLPEGGGSTGLAPGAFWSQFELRNTSSDPIKLRLEYIDHQLIFLRAFQASTGEATFRQLVDLSLERPFSERPIPHHRFVVPVALAAGESAEFFVQYGSHDMGFVFPELRIWSPASLAKSQGLELTVINLIVGGLLVMALIAFVAGVATGGRFFYFYGLHALASIAVWYTVFGFTHQFLLTESFNWRYMSITGAISLLTGLYFAREFLQTRQHTRGFDYLLLFLILNSVFLLFSAVFGQITLAIISITLALLLYPIVSVVGLVRWYQGAREAAIFTFAWTILVIGLFTQALRDLGVVEHNFVNYYWPAVGSYAEMAVILIAMGVRIRDLRGLKEAAERAHLAQLTQSKELLEEQVAERTAELEAAKNAAEVEARTDTLTGVDNRRSFITQGQQMLDRCRREKQPLSLAMLDIDHFKAINDKYGHDVGDRALVAFAQEVMTLIRDRDLFGRVGGEEFALMFGTDREGAEHTAKRLVKQIAEIRLDVPDGQVSFTASIGIAHLIDETDLQELLKLADEALYVAKQTGRNRVSVADRS
ncbi:MAG: diguanylate cyclase [Pseudomonadota bacterium]